MSLNCREIDRILDELKLPGMKIEKILQPSYDTIIFCLYGSDNGRSLNLLVSIAHGACRVHSVRALPAKNERPLRFMECLRSRIRGARIMAAVQLGDERIIRLDIDGNPLQYRLYIRLWSGAGNLLLVDDQDKIVDVLARRPARGELSGQPCRIETLERPAALTLPQDDPQADSQDGANARQKRIFTVRELPGEGSFNQKIETFYHEQGSHISLETLRAQAQERFERRRSFLETRIAELSAQEEEFRNADRLRQIGDILMAGYAAPDHIAPDNMAPARPALSATQGKASKVFVTVQDFYQDTAIKVQIDPRLSQVENAQAYYDRYRKAASGLADVREELARAQSSMERATLWLQRALSEEDPYALAKKLAKAGTVREKTLKPYPGLSFQSKGWTLLVGRSDAENDMLLRKAVRGSDLWLHVRDRPGAYVFVKVPRGKTVPLSILLDAGTLALYYSKARSDARADLYYTFVKYLRRAKDGPKGLVIPSMEKNLYVQLDQSRLKVLLDSVDKKDTAV